MVERISILDEDMFVEELGHFPSRIWMDISERGDRFSISFHVRDPSLEYARDGVLSKFRVRFLVYNPIETGILIAIASKYGACVAWKMGQFTIEKGADDYEAFKELFPKSSVRERVEGVAQNFKHDSKKFRDELNKNLKSCITLGLWRFGKGGDTPEDGPPDI